VSLSEILSESAEALWHVLAVGLVLGVGLPALFASGIRFQHRHRVVDAGSGPTATSITSSPVRLVGAGVCFALCVLAVVAGIIVIIFGEKLFGG
jgi:uncharacterized membrane protein